MGTRGIYENLINNILPYYNIGNLKKDSIEILKGEEAGGNLVLAFETSKGKFVLKQYLRNNANEIIRKINWLTKLIEVNKQIKCPLILTRNSVGYVNLNGNYFSIEYFLEGNLFFENYSDERLISAAEQLAYFHKELPAELRSKKIKLNFTYLKNIEKMFYSYDNKKPIFEIISNFDKQTEFDIKLKEDILPFFKQEYLKLKEGLKKLKKENLKGKISLLHGDLNPLNIIFNGVEVAGLVDFESIFLGLHTYELIKTMAKFSNMEKGEILNFSKLKKFLEAYKIVFGEISISPEEVMIYLRHSILESEVLFLLSYSNLDFEQRKNYDLGLRLIYKYYLKLRFLVEHEKEFIKVFRI